ncbi:MAG: hypothetical protein LKJ69_09745 [Lactobacillus sp.]|jgi:hypothetical protein|nr:hypothetical protein [Lactobacillus sp.]MCI2033643.1 hypothetical protein [Lactobacillus sp.]
MAKGINLGVVTTFADEEGRICVPLPAGAAWDDVTRYTIALHEDGKGFSMAIAETRFDIKLRARRKFLAASQRG